MKRMLWLVFFIGVLIPIAGFTKNDSTKPAPTDPGTKGCVTISTWKDCSNLCTDAKCYQFKNDCTSKVKITFSSKNKDGSWTKYELTLEAGEESDEGMLCPYIEMKWSYVEV
ncbi:MAG: hypothetical protein PHP01_09710 [Phycisphaerae bacterium]|nr:hypothetical protein [Phycisphaerae bacterium]